MNKLNDPYTIVLDSSEPLEVLEIKRYLIGLIKASTDIQHIKAITAEVMGVAGETPEMMQYHALAVENQKEHKDIIARLDRNEAEWKRNFKLIAGAIVSTSGLMKVIELLFGF